MVNCNYEFICCRYIFPNTTRKAGKFGAPEGTFCNTPLVTIQSTFDFMKTYSQRLTPKPTFLLMAGDFHGHDMDLQTKASTLQKLNEFTDFAENMKSGMKIFPSFGNHVRKINVKKKKTQRMDFHVIKLIIDNQMIC